MSAGTVWVTLTPEKKAVWSIGKYGRSRPGAGVENS